jgi:hypothetical protein
MLKRLGAVAVVVVALALVAPAHATNLLNVLVTTAVTAQTTPTLQLRPEPGPALPTNIVLQGTFTYGSGGTSADAYVQTSVDAGATWTDVAEFHFITASARFLYNLSSATPVTAEYTPTDGSLTANTSKDGLIGSMWRVKYSSTGTYAGGTALRVDAFANGLTSFP